MTSIIIEGQTLLLQCLALHKTHIIDGLNTHDYITEIIRSKCPQPRTKNTEKYGYEIECSSDQIAFCVFYTSLKGVQTKLAIYLPYIHT